MARLIAILAAVPMPKARSRAPVRLALVAALIALVVPGAAQAAVFNVNSTVDASDANLGNPACATAAGQCTLRAAVEQANVDGVFDEVRVPVGDYVLAAGQLVVSQPVIIARPDGEGGRPTVRAGGAFRIFCISGTPAVTITGLRLTGGSSSPNNLSCGGDGQGGAIHAAGAGALDLTESVVEGNSAQPSQGGGGGIFKGAGDLTVIDSTVRNNSVNAQSGFGTNGGGGVRWVSGGTFLLIRSTLSGNVTSTAGPNSGGGAIYASVTGVELRNTTLSGNQALGSSSPGGGALLTAGSDFLNHLTAVGNSSAGTGGAIKVLAGTLQLRNSVLSANSAAAETTCSGSIASQFGNVESTNTCNLSNNVLQDKHSTDPLLGPLAGNGSDNGTETHELLARTSPAVEFATADCVRPDQRNVNQFGDQCDSGAYEFDGRAAASIPDCSQTGVISLALDEPPGGDVVGLSYKVDGGTEIQDGVSDVGDPPSPTAVSIPEGRRTLEYWGRWTNGEEKGHGLSNVLVDKTQPNVDVTNNQPRSIFVITRRATVDVNAADALSGLVQNPTANDLRLNTGQRGPATFTSTASDLCTNQSTDSLSYRVLAPGLGFRTVLERTKGRVRVRRASSGSGAQASQKGQSFTPLTDPRELPVGSLIDTRAGTARLTTARTRREDQIQDGLFAAGVFQVLQSRRTRARGLTEVRLKGGNFARCARIGKAGAGAAALPRRIVRRLRGNARGRFRTRGRHSAATVRGTVWQVIDRCDGTLTKVKRGSVRVRDFRRKRTVIVRAGKSYLAKSPGA